MKSLPLLKKQVLILFVFSVLTAVGVIIHGIFFDLDFSQIGRLTLEGIIFTFVLVFPAIIFLEWVFDLNNRKKFDEVDKKIKALEKKKKNS